MRHPFIIEGRGARRPMPPTMAGGTTGVSRRRVGSRLWPAARVAVGVLVLAAFAGVAALYLLSLTPSLNTEGDNAGYIILAKALATGHGYTDIQEPTPRIEAQYPPVFPLLLAPVVRLWGTGAVWPMEALVTACALGAFVLAFVLFRRWTGSTLLALTITLGTASSDLVWSFAHRVLTEIPYLFITLLACWWATRYAGQARWRTWSGALAALAVAAAFLTRTIGLGLCVALPLYLLLAPPLRDADWRRRLCKAAFITLILIILAGGWTLRNRFVYAGHGHNYIEQFLQTQSTGPDTQPLGLPGLLYRVNVAAHYYAGTYARLLNGPTWAHVSASAALSPGLLVLSMLGFVYALIRRRTLAEFYLVGYSGIVLLWPWHDVRFVVPILPFLIYYLATALTVPWRLFARVHPVDPRRAVALILLALSVPTGLVTLHVALADHQAGYHTREWPATADWRDFHAAALWLRRCAPPGSVVINRSPNLMYLWSGRLSRVYPYSFHRVYVLRDISKDRTDYVVDDKLWPIDTTFLYLEPVLRLYADRFQRVYAIHGTTIYRVRHVHSGVASVHAQQREPTMCLGNRP